TSQFAHPMSLLFSNMHLSKVTGKDNCVCRCVCEPLSEGKMVQIFQSIFVLSFFSLSHFVLLSLYTYKQTHTHTHTDTHTHTHTHTYRDIDLRVIWPKSSLCLARMRGGHVPH